MTIPSTSDLSALREVAEKATHPGAQYLAELEASAKKATQGEWTFDGPLTSILVWNGGDGPAYVINTSPARIAAIVEAFAAEKARADAAEALAEVRLGFINADATTIATLTAERDALIRERDEATRDFHEAQSVRMETGKLLTNTRIRAETAERERDEAREALKPFAKWKVAEGLPNGMLRTPDQHPILIGTEHIVYAGDFRRARATLSGAKDEREGT